MCWLTSSLMWVTPSLILSLTVMKIDIPHLDLQTSVSIVTNYVPPFHFWQSVWGINLKLWLTLTEWMDLVTKAVTWCRRWRVMFLIYFSTGEAQPFDPTACYELLQTDAAPQLQWAPHGICISQFFFFFHSLGFATWSKSIIMLALTQIQQCPGMYLTNF